MTARKPSLATGTGSIVLGNLAGQGVLLLATLALTRLYSPESYGEYATLFAVANIAAPIAALKLDAAILLPRDRSDLDDLISTAFVSTVLMGVATAIIVGMLGFAGMLSTAGNAVAATLVGALVIISGSISIFTQCAIRSERYSLLATRPVLQNVGVVATQLGASVFMPNAIGLLVGQSVGRLLGATSLARTISGHNIRPSRARALRALRKYRQFPVAFTPSALLNSLGAQLPLLLCAVVLGTSQAGGVAVAMQLALAPVALVATALGQTFAGRASSLVRDSSSGVLALFLKTSILSASLALLAFLALYFIAPQLAEPLLGRQWMGAGGYFQAVAFAAFGSFVFNSVSRVYTLYAAGKASLAADSLRVILVVGAAGLALQQGTLGHDFAVLVFGGLGLSYLVSWSGALTLCIRNRS
ncbi:oligosaccharide flippase family protein [Brachybacterium sp. AOP24-D1-21]|uniref:oligosaccharide flippase family protein n=1 Tax=Brachybacterium sp. AOP24-D1-21 TaxID=3457711 RepID=UPI0040349EDD